MNVSTFLCLHCASASLEVICQSIEWGGLEGCDQKHLNHFTRILIADGGGKRRLRLIEYHPHLQAILLNGLVCVHSAWEIRPITLL